MLSFSFNLNTIYTSQIEVAFPSVIIEVNPKPEGMMCLFSMKSMWYPHNADYPHL